MASPCTSTRRCATNQSTLCRTGCPHPTTRARFGTTNHAQPRRPARVKRASCGTDRPGVMQRILLVTLVLSMLAVNTASAQNWSFDARKVGLGSPTGGENLASRMIDDEREYRSIVLPFGLIQVFRDFKKF